MLTAIPDENSQTLELIFLAIKLAAKDAGHPFVRSLNEILKEANKILANPKKFSAKGTPESVEFAFFLHMHPELQKLFSKVETFGDISEDQVKDVICNQEKRGTY